VKPLARRWHWRRKHISITSTGVIEAVSAMEVKGVNGGPMTKLTCRRGEPTTGIARVLVIDFFIDVSTAVN